MSPRTPFLALLPLLAPLATAQTSPVRAGALASVAVGPAGPSVHLDDDDDVTVIEHYVNPAFVAPAARVARLPDRKALQGGLVPVPLEDRQEASSLCYDNARVPSPNIFYSMYPGQELVDFAQKSCASSGVATRFGVRVRSHSLDVSAGGSGTSFGVRIYTGGTGAGPGQLGTLVGEYTVSTGLGAVAPGFPVTITFERDFPTPLRIPDGPVAFSYIDQGLPFDAQLVVTTGGSCGSTSYDPATGTLDCLDDYDYPADAGGFHYGASSPASARGSLYFRLFEEAPVAASAFSYNVAPNPDSFTCNPPVIGEPWTGTVDLTTTGHTNALVFGFDSVAQIPLSGGQVLLVGDGGSGELLGFAPRPGPLATFTIPVPNDVAVLGVYVGTQAIHYGGVIPFALSNAMDCIIGTS